MKISDKLKPCPFCGSKLVNICYHPQGCHSVECLECKIRTGEYGGFQSVDVWNKRPDYDRMVEEIAELKKLVNDYKLASDEVTKYKHALSYNESYTGEPEGEIKNSMAELDMVSCKAIKLLAKLNQEEGER